MSETRTTQILELAREARTGALSVMDNDHTYIHLGKFFTVAFKVAIDAAGVHKVVLTTPASAIAVIHYRPANIITSGDKLTLKFYEGASGVAAGSTLTPSNRDRNSLLVAGLVIKSGVTTTGSGTQISEAYIPGSTGVGGSRAGSQLNGNNEWVLKPATTYLIEYTNGSDAANTVFTELQWYEEKE